ncbi:MAG: 4-(cytidine 5'-diphospho)-2-C-methyl-D-erythritol kinase, partial [Actinomycetota bacterium]|nr:4-(cytidine 5'-diphospho)-2-C-methyl-D-erythritol kinase [Actinomycetota bacterium]
RQIRVAAMSLQREGSVPTVRVRVPAKVNLFLAVRGLRPDGMHDIVSVLHTVTLYDELTASLESPLGSCYHPANRRLFDVVLEHDAGPQVPRDDSNLAMRAARSLAGVVRGRTSSTTAGPDTQSLDVPVQERSSELGLMTRLVLEKRIPVAGGMAGGSADAAGALLALNRLWECGLDHESLKGVAATLGADVPFCVTGGTALATGTGAAAAQVLCRASYHWVVGIDSQPLSTRSVYEAWDEVGVPSSAAPDQVLQALRSDDPEALAAALHNDLEVAAFHLRPSLREASTALLDAGALRALVSGSGPTLVALAGNARHARQLATAVADCFDRVEVVRSPAGGPEVRGWR